MKQRKDAYVSLLVDFYGIGGDWPGLDLVQAGASPSDITAAICSETQSAVDAELSDYGSNLRFVPHIAVHEFEALLFSEPATLARAIQVDRQQIEVIIEECGEPEAIDNSPATAPSKRIEQLNQRFKKTSDGIAIAQDIGVEQMRSVCPVFNSWLDRLESLASNR